MAQLRGAQPLAHGSNAACGAMAYGPQDFTWVRKFGGRRVVAINTVTPCLLPNSQVSQSDQNGVMPHSLQAARLVLVHRPPPLEGQTGARPCLLPAPTNVARSWLGHTLFPCSQIGIGPCSLPPLFPPSMQLH